MEYPTSPHTATTPLIHIKELFDNGDFTPLFKHLDTLNADQRERCCNDRKTFNVYCVGIYCMNCPLKESNRYLYELYRNGTPHSEIFLKCAKDYKVQKRDLIGTLSKYPLPLAQLIYDETIKYTSGECSIKTMQMRGIDHLFEFTETSQGLKFWSNVLHEKWEFIDEQYRPQRSVPTDNKISHLPVEIINKMLDEQELQGNTRNINVFKLSGPSATYHIGGFNWERTVDGFEFWVSILNKNNYDLFFTKYPKASSPPTPNTVLKPKLDNQNMPLIQSNHKHIGTDTTTKSNTDYNHEPLKFKNNGKFTHL